MTAIFHAHLYGNRDSKYRWLIDNDISSTVWEKVQPKSPFYLLTPQNSDLLEEYEYGWKITEVMPTNVLGFQTHRDHFAIDFNEEKLKQRISEMRNMDISEIAFSKKYNLKNNSGWKVKEARQKVFDDPNWERELSTCSYRLFDNRSCYFSHVVMDRPRRELLDHVVRKENICLGIGRQGIAVNDPIWSSITVSELPMDSNIFRRGGVNVFPLYLYSGQPDIYRDCRPNFSQNFLKEFVRKLGYSPLPKQFFCYIYALLHSPAYRTRYAEFLKIDFPRIPITSDQKLFEKMVEYGSKLIELHLAKSAILGDLVTKFEEKSDCTVAPGHPKYKSGKVIINKQGDGFVGVPEEVWNFHIGGYQVCHKWLKDRKGRTLSDDDILHYQRIVVALKETIVLMQKIDEAIPSWPIE